MIVFREDSYIASSLFRYVKPNHLSTSEFLQEVTTPEGVRYLQPGYPRLERDDFVASFLLSPTFRDICRVVDSVDLVQELWLQVRFLSKAYIYFLSRTTKSLNFCYPYCHCL